MSSMDSVKQRDFEKAVESVLHGLSGISGLYDSQTEVLQSLVTENANLFVTSPTNSGKTLPPVIVPAVLLELNTMGYEFPASPRVLFQTALNSIQLSLMLNMKSLGIQCSAVTRDNVDQVLISETPVLFIGNYIAQSGKVLADFSPFVGPEVLKVPEVTKSLLKYRESFVLTVIDEAHLGEPCTIRCV